MTTKVLGDRGEDLVAKDLAKNGYEILARNWHAREGELDIVAREKDEYVFVEVKTRRSEKYGLAKSAVNDLKIKKMVKAIQNFFEKNKISQDSFWRIDVVAVGQKNNQLIIIEHLKNVTLD